MLTLPYQLGPYRLEKALGHGGMGVVYEAYHERLRRRVAIKRVRSGMDDPRRRARLQREARTMAQLAHPSIVQVFDLIEHDDSDWIVMERVEGTSLAQRLKEGRLDVDTTLRLGMQIAEGLSAAHGIGVVHRDLKTENVMVQPDGRAKILDFGIAKQLGPVDEPSGEHDLSRTGEVLGTSRALAPEQARGLAVGPRADLFSLGVLLYETLTGTSPFRGATPLDTLTRVLTHTPSPVDELVPEVPVALAELVERLLRKSPEQRPAGAAEVMDAVRRIQESRRPDTGSVVDSVDPGTGTATVWGTGALGGDPAVPEPSVDEAFWVSPSMGRSAKWIGLSVVLASVLGILALRSWQTPASPAVSTLASPAPEEATAEASLPELYEDGMQLLHRVDRPENVDKAMELFLRLVDQDPESAMAHAGLARAYWEKSRNTSGGGDSVFLQQALGAGQEAVRLNGYLAEARTSLGLVLYSLNREAESRSELEIALGLEPTHADALYGLGKLAESEDQVEEAEEHYREALELRPETLWADALGALFYNQGRYDEAESAFDQSLALAPDNVNALRNLASIYYAQGRLEATAEMLQKALKIRPNASLFSNLGTLFFSRGLYSKAAAAYEDALRLDGASNQYIYWLNLGDAYRQIPGKEAEAQRSYQRAIQTLDGLLAETPTNARRLSRRALALLRSGDADSARDDVVVLRKVGPRSDLYSRFRWAVAEELLGERERAIQVLEEALRSGFSLAEVRHEPDLQDLRSDLRFHHLLVELEPPRDP